MEYYHCGCCGSSHNTLSGLTECEINCAALNRRHKACYGDSFGTDRVAARKPTTIVINMPNDVVVKITSCDCDTLGGGYGQS
jgi:hypothetical protein